MPLPAGGPLAISHIRDMPVLPQLPEGAVVRRFSCREAAVGWPAAIAIPAKQEAATVTDCLSAVAGSIGRSPLPAGIVLAVNDSADRTYALAGSWLAERRLPHVVLDVELPAGRGSAGVARRLALDVAAALVAPDGLLLTTDADSRPHSDWVAQNLAAIAAGADVVCGEIDIDAADWALLPSRVRCRILLERAYAGLTTRFDSLLDPSAPGPATRQRNASGASIACRQAVYRDVGGMPPIACGEDRAFAAAAAGRGWRVRHAPDVRVTTSGRLTGRARGGMADTLASWVGDQAAACDQAMKPASVAP